MNGKDSKPPAAQSDKARARRARQAEALRRNLALRKAQARSRAGDGGNAREPDTKPGRR